MALPTMSELQLEAGNPLHEAAYGLASDLYEDGYITQFDPSIIILIIEILMAILPLIQQYCPADAAAVARNAAALGWLQRLRWMAAIRAKAVRSIGYSGWGQVGGYAFARGVIDATAKNEGNVVGRLLMVCG